ncbi:hypothetical protein DLAC_02087 [Tieghemostelium lacteum]|uniref:Uncharacterized protein n=1 Tax=Tieghemostelium lacteum TaxID=361077 RepID=A0A152A478_TIELA|nr:hypothetical protein DLAC_02087 [Tieghemostelium lacteum]|eukprot:KYR01009.1 hypothetical protein DLAC_02087 [Tieghemostelium lacteum]
MSSQNRIERIFYKSIHQDKPIYSEGCIKCGSLSECTCSTDTKWEEFLESCTFTEYQQVFDVFYQWCNEPDDSKLLNLYNVHKLSINENNEDDEDLFKNTPNCNYISTVDLLVPFIENNPHLICKFNVWMDSKNPRQRIVSYLLVLQCRKSHKIIDKLFRKSIVDYEVFHWMKRLNILTLNYNVKTIDICQEILEKLVNDKSLEIDKVQMDFLIQYLIEPNIYNLDYDSQYTLYLFKLKKIYGSSNQLQRVIDLVILDISPHTKNDGIKEYFLEVIFDYLDNFQKKKSIITTIINCFNSTKDNRLYKLLSKYLIENMNSSDDFIKHRCFAIILHNKITNVDFDRFLFYYIKNTDSCNAYKVIDKFKNIEEYFDHLLEFAPKDPVLCTEYYCYMFDRLSVDVNNPLSSMSEWRIMAVHKMLEYKTIVQVHPIIEKFFPMDHECTKKLIACLPRTYREKIRLTISHNVYLVLKNTWNMCKWVEKNTQFEHSGKSNEFYHYVVKMTSSLMNSIHSNLRDRLAIVEFSPLVCQLISDNTKFVLSCLRKCKYDPCLEILQIFNDIIYAEAFVEGSPEEVVEYLKKLWPKVKIMKTAYQLADISKFNIISLMHQHVDMEEDLIDLMIDYKPPKTVTVELLLKVIRDPLKYPNKVISLIHHRYYNILSLFYMVDLDTLPSWVQILYDLSLKFHLESNDEINTDQFNGYLLDPLSIYQKEMELDSQKTIFLYTNMKNYPHFYVNSKQFLQFYKSLPINIQYAAKSELGLKLKIEMVNRLYPMPKEVDTHAIVQLPTIIYQNVIHWFYAETNITSGEKINLATVSKTFFKLCSYIVSNYFDTYNIVNYLSVENFSLVNINAEYSLLKNFPKVFNYDDFEYLNSEEYERVLYSDCESLKLEAFELGEFHSIQLNRVTNIKYLQLQFPAELPVQAITSLLENSPLLQYVDLYMMKDQSINSTCTYIDYLLSLESLVNLKEINAYSSTFGELNKILQKHYRLRKQKKAFEWKLPKVHLIHFSDEIVQDGPVEMFHTAHIEVNLVDDLPLYRDIVSGIDIIQVYSGNMSLIKETIETFHQSCKDLSIFFRDIHVVTVEQVQSIFDFLDDLHRKSKSTLNNIALSFYPDDQLCKDYSLLDLHLWTQINLKRYSIPNNYYTTFFNTLP